MSSQHWQKSSYSGATNECMEVRTADGLVEVRESDEGETILRTNPTTFAALLHGLKTGEFDHHT
ncbi:DUF397 domain-containing protein [Kitasatospora sp. NPDC058162]|uniref:DUF397 domain-containing protein n=1 Tax=Kitasatospora sp. NPDC058162 TaxID=3346362 RepID=UPI0036D947AA